MAKIYKRDDRRNFYAHVKVWSEAENQYVWKRIATGTADREAALALAEALERASEQVKPLTGRKITREHAESLLASVLASAGVEIDSGIDYPLFREISEKYMQRAKNKVSASTYQTYTTKANTVDAWLGGANPTVDFFTEDRLEDFYASLLENSSNKTANETMRHLSRVLDLVVPKVLPYNPVSQVKLASNQGSDTLDRTPLTMGEVMMIVNKMPRTGRCGEFRIATIIAASTSCRMTDAVLMSSENLTNGVMTYRQSKTKKTVSIPIVNPVWLSELKSMQGDYCPELKEEYRARRTSTMSSEYTELITELGVDQDYKVFAKSGRRVARKTFHSLRHTLRSELINKGATSEIADMITGHSGDQGKTYTHMDIASMRKHLESVFS